MSFSKRVGTSPRFYDVAEVASILRMSRMTVYRAVNSGELRAVRIRGRILIPAKVIEELADAIDEQAVMADFNEIEGGVSP